MEPPYLWVLFVCCIFPCALFVPGVAQLYMGSSSPERNWKWSCLVMSDSLQPHGLYLPGSSIHGIFQARLLEWVAIPFSRGSSQPRERIWVSCSAGRLFTVWATRGLQGSNPHPPALEAWSANHRTPREVHGFFWGGRLWGGMATPCSLQALRSPTRNWVHAPCSGRMES